MRKVGTPMIASIRRWARTPAWPEALHFACTAALAGFLGLNSALAGASPDQTGTRPIRIELGAGALAESDAIELLFSANGQMIYAGWHDWRVVKTDYGYLPKSPEFRVFSLAGKQLCSSKDADHSLMWTNFPTAAWRETQAAFLTNTVGGIFNPAYSWGLRVFRLSTLWDIRIECWSLPVTAGATPLWSREMDKAFSCRPVAIVDKAEEQLLLVLDRAKAVILSRRTGATVRELILGRAETDEEVAKRNRGFGLQVDDGDPSSYFSPCTFSYDQSKHLLACGAFFDKRVRVIDIFAPEKEVFEANTDVNPAWPPGGSWKVRRVQFASGGNYLVARYVFSGRKTKVSIDSTEIFDSGSWKCVWKTDDPKISSVTLSLDGRSLAYVRDKAIEIIPFQPKR